MIWFVIIVFIIVLIVGGKTYSKSNTNQKSNQEKNKDLETFKINKIKEGNLNKIEENSNKEKDNKTMMQYFEWHYPNDGSLWNKLKEESKELKGVGITSLWIPPAYKGAKGIDDVGYGIYDLYDLGEFNQKGTIRTKYGTKDEYISAINEAQKNGIEVYADIVFNHKCGADESELVNAQLVDKNNRNKIIENSKDIKAFTVFNFPGRGEKYSSYKWKASDFTGVDFDDLNKHKGIFKFSNKQWSQDVDNENGNYDFLMGADIDMDNPNVINELKAWGDWYIKETNIDGIRLDAIKHIKFDFFKDWLDHVRMTSGKKLFAVGEYWSGDINKLKYYKEKVQDSMLLFDVPLHYKFFDAANLESEFDMRSILRDTLVEYDEKCAVTFIENHDTQPGQSLESWIKSWFKLLSYTFILTRKEGYPCVFYGDYYGIPEKKFPGFKKELDVILKVRKDYAYGIQHDYIDDKNVIGWTREGDDFHENSGIAALISNGRKDNKTMFIGEKHSGMDFFDISGNIKEKVVIDEKGYGNFSVNSKSYSIWIKE
ncbi:alpha-amylase [Clostridium weizhouense]|uniref:Alpha-amylase n=1 Tax=Clostridium weizhouense TaxID=2859781 RepID=A0ABS7AL27_9CLOT|nr:alpha-amylase [Clostridium weizhouense]MBW6409373.1 alpha-amylase [Clostridium weizhouense]